MAHKLITLLDGSTNEALALQELRQMTRDGVDIELIAEIMVRAHRVLRRLGLDPSDVTAREVYNALLNAVEAEQWLSILEDTEFVLLEIDGQVVSFNPIDVVNNYHHQLPLEERQAAQAKAGLGWEITRRYQQHTKTKDSRVREVAKAANWPTDEPLFCRIDQVKPTILIIGDIATEALIILGKEGVEILGSKPRQKISLNLGARIDCHSAATVDAAGGAANVSVAMSRLGVQPVLMSWLGDDASAKQSLNYLRLQGVDMSGVVQKKNSRSNYHYVLRHGLERTILANYEPFDYVWRQPVCEPNWIYLSMISSDSEQLHEELLDYLRTHEQVRFAFQPGASHIEKGIESFKGLYERSDVVIMNMDEAMSLTNRTVRNASVLMKQLFQIGLKTIVITDGLKGAYASDGKVIYHVPHFPDATTPVDRTGAGDAFASVLVAELAKGRSLGESLKRAPINSMSVVSQLGAQMGLLSSQEIDAFLTNAPADYGLTEKTL